MAATPSNRPGEQTQTAAGRASEPHGPTITRHQRSRGTGLLRQDRHGMNPNASTLAPVGSAEAEKF